MGDDYRVKGSSIRSKFDFVRDRFGEAAEGQPKERFRERGLLGIQSLDWDLSWDSTGPRFQLRWQ